MRSHRNTDRNGLQCFLCCTWHANRPTVLRLYSEYTATVQRFKETDCNRIRSTVAHCCSTLVLWSQYGPYGCSAVAVHSCDHRSSTVAARLWTIVLRPHYELCERRPTADRSHSDRKIAARNFEQFKIPQRPPATVRRPVRPTTITLRPYWDFTAICRDLVQKLVAASVWLGYYVLETNITINL